MHLKVKISCISQGFLRAIILTIICLMAYTLIATFGGVSVSDKTYGIIFMVITLISVLLGAGYASKRADENGWLVGMLVGLTYIVFIYVVSMISMGKFSFCLSDLMRILLCVFAGTLSGMLGINV